MKIEKIIEDNIEEFKEPTNKQVILQTYFIDTNGLIYTANPYNGNDSFNEIQERKYELSERR